MAVSIERFFSAFSLPLASLSVMAGILSVNAFTTLLPVSALMMLVGLIAALFCAHIVFGFSKNLIFLAKLAACIAIGVLATHLEIYRQPHHMLEQTEQFQFQAVVQSSEWRDNGAIRAIVRPVAISDGSGFVDLRHLGHVRLTLRLDTAPLSGTLLDISARLFPLSGPFLPGMTDYGRLSYVRGIGASGFAYSVKNISQPSEITTFSNSVENIRTRSSRYLTSALTPPVGAIASSMYLGKRDELPADIYLKFQQSGLAHLLAISGLHMALFCMSLYGVLRSSLLPLEPHAAVSAHKIAAFIAVLAGFGYLIIAGMPVSAIRAWAIATIILAAVLVDRRALTIRTLALIAIILLLWRPSFLYQAAFQLSFSASFAIVAMHKAMQTYLPRKGVSGYIISLMVSSLAAGVITAPFIAYHFALFTPWSLLLNLLAVPLMGLVMPLGLLAIGEDIIGVTSIFVRLYEASILFLIEIADYFSALPAAGIWIKPPDIWLLVMWVAGLSAIAVRSRALISDGAGTLILFAAAWITSPVPDALQVEINDKPVTIINGDNEIISAKPLSPFWQSVIQRRLGVKPIHHCEVPICAAQIKGRSISLIAERRGLTQACKSDDGLYLSAYSPRYSCEAGYRMVIIPPINSSALLYLDVDDIEPEEELDVNALASKALQINQIPHQIRPWRVEVQSRPNP